MVDASDASCPECGAELSGARVCPECDLLIRTEDDELTEDAVSAVVDGALADSSGVRAPEHVVPYSLRLAVALAISVPFAPLSAFVLASVVAPHPIAVVVVGTLGWMAPAAVLARATVPSLVVGRGLVALGIAVAASPVVVAIGRTLVGGRAVVDPLIESAGTLLGAFVLFGAVVFALGIVVSRIATRKREAWSDSDGTRRRSRL